MATSEVDDRAGDDGTLVWSKNKADEDEILCLIDSVMPPPLVPVLSKEVSIALLVFASSGWVRSWCCSAPATAAAAASADIILAPKAYPSKRTRQASNSVRNDFSRTVASPNSWDKSDKYSNFC